MSKAKKIEEICAGKTIRIFGARADRNTASFVESFRNCGRKECLKCADRTKRPHGPYWTLNYFDEHSRSRSLYIGRKLPELAGKHVKVTFADVLTLYRESEEHSEVLRRKNDEINRIKKQLESLYEELRATRRQARHGAASGSGGPERFFRQLVLKYHPDRNSHRSFQAEDVMKDINQLYQKLVKS